MRRRDPIEAYVAELRVELGRRGLRRRLLKEVEAHLCEAVAVRIGGGAPPDEAAAAAVRSFGAPREVAAALAREVPEVRRLPRVPVTAAGTAMAAVVITLAVMSAGPAGQVERESSAPRALDDETARVAEALRLSPDASKVLAKAQMLGERASDCLLEHGALATAGGGLNDPSGQAHGACQLLLKANERYLSHPDFIAVLSEAQPRFAAAERCQALRNPARARATASPNRPVTAGGAAVSATCFRRDGLPATNT